MFSICSIGILTGVLPLKPTRLMLRVSAPCEALKLSIFVNNNTPVAKKDWFISQLPSGKLLADDQQSGKSIPTKKDTKTLASSQSRGIYVCINDNPCFRVILFAGGGGTQQSFIRGGSASSSKPLPFYIPFLAEKMPLSYTFRRKFYPFHIPTKRLLPNFWREKLLKIK